MPRRFRFVMLVVSCVLGVVGEVEAADATITKGGLYCISYTGIQSAAVGMNDKQLKSLGCIAVGRDTIVHLVEDYSQSSIYHRVDATLPDRIIQGYAHDAIGTGPGLVRGR